MEIKYFVRTTGDRVLDKSLEQIDYTLIIDKSYDPFGSFVKALLDNCDYNFVLLEDDVVLCHDFKAKIEAVINEHPNDIINFYTRPMEYFTSQWSLDFHFNQCTYYPKGITKNIINKMIELHTYAVEHNLDYGGYDIYESNSLRKLNIPHFQFRPCLVQHNDHNSLISSSHDNRVTPYFVDYIDTLGIDYNSKETLLSYNKLILQRDAHIFTEKKR